MSVAIFCGPTISAQEVCSEIPSALVLPPAAQGDVYLATKAGPLAIGLIDGYFHQVPAVWHKEILWALHKGIFVFGAASMGALRAAELYSFGMIGVGEIFEAYRAGVIQDDDEVAILHASPDAGYAACTDAMVDIRWTMRAACAEGILSQSLAARIEKYAKSLHYSERTFHRLFSDLLHQSEQERLSSWLVRGRVRQKWIDSLALCRAIRLLLQETNDRNRPTLGFERTLHWVRLTQSLDRAHQTLPTKSTSSAR